MSDEIEKEVLYDDLDPGIRRTVAWLRARDFRTTDSGDGVSKDGIEMPSALPFPNVAMVVDPTKMIAESHRLLDLLRAAGVTVPRIVMSEDEPAIQVSYSPADEIAVMLLANVNDAALFGG